MQEKTKLQYRQGFFTMAFSNGKFVEFIDKAKFFPKDSQIISIPSTKFCMLWGTREKLAYKTEGQYLHIGLSGEIDLEVKNPRKFYNDVLLANKDINDMELQRLISPIIVSQLDIFIKEYITKNNLSIQDLETYKSQLAREFRIVLVNKLELAFGITCKNFLISRVLLDDDEMQKIKNQNQQNLLLKEKERQQQKINQKNSDISQKTKQTTQPIYQHENTSNDAEYQHENTTNDAEYEDEGMLLE